MTRRHIKSCSGNVRAAAIAAATITLVSASGCSPKIDSTPQTAAAAASNVTLTAAQRQNIHLYTVESSRFRKTIQATGAVDFDNDQATSVLAPFSGPVSRLLVSLGGQVKEGDALAAVDSPDFAAAISSYRKAIASAQTSRRLADLDKDLGEHHGVSQREAQQAETDAANAEADRESARQMLISLKIPAQVIKDIQDGQPVSHVEAVIRAPIAGTVVERLITPGELLQAGTTACFTIADLSRVWVMAQVFGSDFALVAPGDPADVQTGDGSERLSGTVDNISALVNPDTRSVLVRVVVKNPGQVLKKQMYVRVLLQPRREITGLLVPVAAILRDDENLPFVYRARADGSFERQHVNLGDRTGDQYDIADGLQAGDKIVVEGGIFVQFMQNQ